MSANTQTVCPKCGCHDIAEYKALFVDMIFVCRHCRTRFDPPAPFVDPTEPEPVAIFARTTCPRCQTTDNTITRGPLGPHRTRRHHCKTCDLPFVSREI
jgi:hypothetical protein